MAIYVDAKLAEKNIDNADFSWCTDVDNIIEACIEALQSTPQADVAPVIHSRWIVEHTLIDDIKCTCANCSATMFTTHEPPAFCFGCGAKMDEEVE